MSSTSPSLRWTIAVLLCLSTALNYLDRQVLSILATTIQKDLGIDDIGYAKITTYFLLSYTIMYAVSGRLVDFLGTRLSLAWAVAGWSVAGMLHGAANSVAQLSLCRFILGTFEAANFPREPRRSLSGFRSRSARWAWAFSPPGVPLAR